MVARGQERIMKSKSPQRPVFFFAAVCVGKGKTVRFGEVGDSKGSEFWGGSWALNESNLGLGKKNRGGITSGIFSQDFSLISFNVLDPYR